MSSCVQMSNAVTINHVDADLLYMQRNLLDAVEGLKALLEQTYTAAERQPCDQTFQLVIQQLRAL